MAINALIGILAPFLLSWWIIKKYGVSVRTILIGALVFIVFALGLETILHQVVLKGPHGPAIIGNFWYYALYGGLAAGIFEETGRFLAMKLFLKKESSAAKNAVAYGLGHGGAELLVIFGITMISNLALAVMINSGQSDTIIASAPAANHAQVEAQLASIQALTAGSLLFGLWERVSAIILQIGLSIIVWTAVRKGGKWLWLFPAAILLHAVVDAVAVILSKSAGMLATEIVVCAMAIAVGAMAWLLAKKLKQEAEPLAPAAE